MDRWRSGTPETCHSSHHHAICTPSPSLSLSLIFVFVPSSILPFFRSSCFYRCHTSTVFLSPSLRFLPSFPPTIFRSALWHSFLGFRISSGDIPPFFSPFSPPSPALAIFSPLNFFGNMRRKISFPRKKDLNGGIGQTERCTKKTKKNRSQENRKTSAKKKWSEMAEEKKKTG